MLTINNWRIKWCALKIRIRLKYTFSFVIIWSLKSKCLFSWILGKNFRITFGFWISEWFHISTRWQLSADIKSFQVRFLNHLPPNFFPNNINSKREFTNYNTAIRPNRNNWARNLCSQYSLASNPESFKPLIQKDTLFATVTLKHDFI
jgi:hypothetical protein